MKEYPDSTNTTSYVCAISRQEWEKNIPAVYEILKKGSEEAQQVAAQTLRDVRASMKINYFDDAALIKEQMEKYSK